MTTYARFTDGIVEEVIDFNPEGRFHHDVAAMFVEVPDGTGQRDVLNPDGSYTKYIAPPPPLPNPKIAIFAQLAEIDAQSESPRAKREAALGNVAWLASLDAQAAALRAQLKAL